MTISKDKVRIMITVPKELADGIDEYANRFRHSRSTMGAIILQNGFDALRLYDKYIIKPENAYRIGSFIDRIAKSLGMPQIWDTDGKTLEQEFTEHAIERDKEYKFEDEL